MTLTNEQNQDWKKWLSERPENVKSVAEKIVPWKKYIDKRIVDDIGNRYRPISYDEDVEGRITLTCEKSNEEMPVFGGINVFGIDPDDLIEE